MEVTIKKGELLLKGEFILENAEDIKVELSDKLTKIKGEEIKLNLFDVKELDSAGLQIILSFCKTLKSKGIEYSVNKINDEILNILEISGLSKYLNT